MMSDRLVSSMAAEAWPRAGVRLSHLMEAGCHVGDDYV